MPLSSSGGGGGAVVFGSLATGVVEEDGCEVRVPGSLAIGAFEEEGCEVIVLGSLATGAVVPGSLASGVVEAGVFVVMVPGVAPVWAFALAAAGVLVGVPEVEGAAVGVGAVGIGLTTGCAFCAAAAGQGYLTGGPKSPPLPAPFDLLSGASGASGGITPCEAIVCFANSKASSRSWILVA